LTTIHVACPVCHTTLTYEHSESDAFGRLSAWDYGIVEITGHDKGVLAEHKNSHTLAQWAEVREREAAAHSALAAKSRQFSDEGVRVAAVRGDVTHVCEAGDGGRCIWCGRSA
jgi:hypothetical protein